MRTVLLVLFVSMATFSRAADRVALVIGNDGYPGALSLDNAVRDASTFGDRLRGGGYEVFSATDAGIRDTLKALREFCEAAKGAEVALFFYSGHGVEVAGENFMIPVDARLNEQVDLDLEVLSLDKLQREMSASGARLKVIVLDCCRDNPFVKERSWMTKSRSLGRGLADVEEEDIPEGTMLVFSAAPGKTAADGLPGQRHSPFTLALLEETRVPGRGITSVFSRVSKAVAAQEPWIRFDGSGKTLAAFTECHLLPGTPAPTEPRRVPGEMVKRNERTSALLIVPDQFDTIQQAVDAARAEDVVLIREGIRYETVKLTSRKKLEIRGEKPETTILRVRTPTAAIDVQDSQDIRISGLSFEYAGEPLGLEKLPEEEFGTVDEKTSFIRSRGDRRLSIENCRFNGNHSISGVNLSGSEFTVAHCHFLKTIAGIQSYGTGNGDHSSDLKTNRFDDALFCGIWISDGAKTSVRENSTNGGVRGICILGSSRGTLIENRCSNAKGAGIELQGEAECEVRDNQSRGNFVGIGILGEKTRATLSGNLCENNKEFGIHFGNGASGEAKNNQCLGNGNIGISVFEKGTSAILVENNLRRNKNFGIALAKGAIGSLKDNSCLENGSGIFASGADTKVSIVGNTCANNHHVGIAISRDCYPTEFRDNNAYGNKRDINRNIDID